MNATNDLAAELLAEVRKTHDTTKLTTDEFTELATALLFYAKSFPPADAARMAIEDVYFGSMTPSEAGVL